MPQGRDKTASFLRRINVRVTLLLTVVLLPLGLIAVFQTRQVTQEIERRAELSLEALTARAASEERQIVERAFGVATALVPVAISLHDDPERCHRRFRAVLDRAETFSFIGFAPVDGQMSCSTAPETIDLTGLSDFQASMADPRSRVGINRLGLVSERSVVIVSQPVTEGDAFLGYIAVSIPHEAIVTDRSGIVSEYEIATFNGDGDVMTSSTGMDEVEQILPRDRALASFAAGGQVSFTAISNSGDEFVYSVSPIIPGVLYALGVWDSGALLPRGLPFTLPAFVFPMLMWIATLAAAYLALNRLVIRHIESLRGEMRGFARTRRVTELKNDPWMPTEFAEMEETFRQMTDRIVRDEAELENTLYERTMLTREVHHRVKNNLQLIASIMNMQIRQSASPETKSVLRRLQDRVLSLATIHQSMHLSDTAASVRVDELIGDLMREVVHIARDGGRPKVDLDLDLDPLLLYPDEAVPLSLIASEAATNASRYAAAGDTDADPWVRGKLKVDRESMSATFSVENSQGPQLVHLPDEASTGLGSRLIEAFASQIGGRVETERANGRYRLAVHFTIEPGGRRIADHFETQPGAASLAR